MTEDVFDNDTTQICYEEFADVYDWAQDEKGQLLSFQYFNDPDQKALIEKYAAENRIWTEYDNEYMDNRLGYVNRFRYIVSKNPYEKDSVGNIVVDPYIREVEECQDAYDLAQYATLWANSALKRHTLYMAKKESMVARAKIEHTLIRLQSHVSEDIEYGEDLTRSAYLRGLLKYIQDAAVALESFK